MLRTIIRLSSGIATAFDPSETALLHYVQSEHNKLISSPFVPKDATFIHEQFMIDTALVKQILHFS